MLCRTDPLLCERLFVELLAHSYLNACLMKSTTPPPRSDTSDFAERKGRKGAGYVLSRHSVSDI